jgi:uncharacterized membrane protein
VLPDGLILPSIVVGIALFTGWKGGEMVFRHRVGVYAEPRAQSQSGKELISCPSPRII